MTNRRACDSELTGYYPGVLGKIIELHAVYYHENWGFDVSFETQVGSELTDFIHAFDPERDGFWAALVDGRFAGAIAIDGRQSPYDGARLRWFIVDPGCQGSGVGTTLIRESLLFCRNAGHRKVFLWTFQGLEPARRIYERHGFILAEEHRIDQWGTSLIEQKFELDPENMVTSGW